MKWKEMNALIIFFLITISSSSEISEKIEFSIANTFKNIAKNKIMNENMSQAKIQEKLQKTSNVSGSSFDKYFFMDKIYKLNDDYINNQNIKSKKDSKADISINIKKSKSFEKSHITPSFLLIGNKAKKNSEKYDLKNKEVSKNEFILNYDDFFIKFPQEKKMNTMDKNSFKNNFLEKFEDRKKSLKIKDKPINNQSKLLTKKTGLKYIKVLDKENEELLKIKAILENYTGKRDSKNKKELSDLNNLYNHYSRCSDKKEILFQFQELKENPVITAREVHMKPVMIHLNKYSMNFYNSPNPTSIFFVTRIKLIKRISQQKVLQKYFCFDIIYEKIENSEEEHKKTICADDEIKMKNWIDSIQEFKECRVDVQNINHNDKLVYDFSKINELLRRKKSVQKPGEPNVKTLYYDNTYRVNIKPQIEKDKENDVKKILNKIIGNYQSLGLREIQIKRDYINKMKNAKEFNEKIQEQKNDLLKKIQSNLEKERMNNIKLIDIKNKNMELDLLKAAENKIKTMRLDDFKNLKKNYNDDIKNKLKNAEKQAEKIVDIIVDSKKNSSYQECIDSRLINFEDKSYIKGVCKRIFGEHYEKPCREKPNYCGMCCNHHIGKSYPGKLFNCKNKCTQIIKGKKIQKKNIKTKKQGKNKS